MSNIKGKLTTSDYLTFEEFNRLCKGLHEDKAYRWELYSRLSFCTALRASDVLSLRWSEVLDQKLLIKVEHKTGKSRQIEFSESVIDKIKLLYELLGSPDTNLLIFANAHTGEHYTIQYINRKLKRFQWQYRLSIKAFSTHTFRKTFGRYVYELMGRSGESLILLNSIFRHTSIDITKVYIGITKDEIGGVFKQIKF